MSGDGSGQGLGEGGGMGLDMVYVCMVWEMEGSGV